VSARAALVFAAIAMSGSAIADEFGGPDRPKHEWPDGPNRDFLKNLQRPDNHKRYRDPHAQSCCDAADTVQTKFKAEAGDGPHPEDQEHAWLNEKWASIPSDKIFLTSAPTGAPFVLDVPADFEGLSGFREIVCFVRPARRAIMRWQAMPADVRKLLEWLDRTSPLLESQRRWFRLHA
jgi:hypothetical protein